MGHKQKKSYPGIAADGSVMPCDSKEEMYFTWWLRELIEAGYIDGYSKCDTVNLSFQETKQVLSVTKKGKIVTKDIEILDKHSYTPDFYISWTDKAIDVFLNIGVNPEEIFMFEAANDDFSSSIVEIKPAFDQNNMTRLAMINVKWMMAHACEFVNIIVPVGIPDKGKRQKKKCLFHHTFTPRRFLLTDIDKTTRKIKHPTRSLDDYLQHVDSIKKKYSSQRSVLEC